MWRTLLFTVISTIILAVPAIAFAQDTKEKEVYVYITPNGEVWHSTPSCGSLAHSENVKKVPLSSVSATRRPCSKCVHQSGTASSVMSSTQPSSSAKSSSGEYYNGHKVYTGPRGGKYYINSSGNKVYIKK